MNGEIGTICISEKEALRIKNEFDELFNSYEQYENRILRGG